MLKIPSLIIIISSHLSAVDVTADDIAAVFNIKVWKLSGKSFSMNMAIKNGIEYSTGKAMISDNQEMRLVIADLGGDELKISFYGNNARAYSSIKKPVGYGGMTYNTKDKIIDGEWVIKWGKTSVSNKSDIGDGEIGLTFCGK